MKLLLQTTSDTKTKTNKLQSVNPSVSVYCSTQKVNTYSEFAGIKKQKAAGNDSSGFPGARGEEVTTPMGGSHCKHQETVGFPHARSELM